MKIGKINKYFLLAASGLMSLASCQEDLAELNKGNDTLTLAASKTEVVLDEHDATAEALTLSWTSGSNYGTNARLVYTLEIAPAGTEFASSDVLVSETQYDDKALSRSFTVQELNKYLHDAGLILEYGETVELEARITADVAGYDNYTQTATASFKVSTYKPAPETLYISGDATTAGWSENAMLELALVNSRQPGIFSIITTLQAEKDFKFFVERSFDAEQYGRPADSEAVLENGEAARLVKIGDGVDDLKFQVAETHAYKITVNLLDMTITVVETSETTPAYDMIYFVGDFNGWSFTPMKVDPVNPFVFLYGDFFENAGGREFKFGTADGSWENMYKAKNESAAYTDSEVAFVTGYEPDNKWTLTEDQCGKAYKIRLDITAGSEKMEMVEFAPYPAIYMVGDATPGGWSLDDATEMAKADDYTFTWSGFLNSGEIKFSCDKQSDWMGAWFMAPEANAEFATSDSYFIDKANSDYADVDFKWVVAESGNYTVTINQATEKLTVEKK